MRPNAYLTPNLLSLESELQSEAHAFMIDSEIFFEQQAKLGGLANADTLSCLASVKAAREARHLYN